MELAAGHLAAAIEMANSCFHDSSLTGNFTVGSDYVSGDDNCPLTLQPARWFPTQLFCRMLSIKSSRPGSLQVISGNLSPDLGMGLFGVRRMGTNAQLALYQHQFYPNATGGQVDRTTPQQLLPPYPLAGRHAGKSCFRGVPLRCARCFDQVHIGADGEIQRQRVMAQTWWPLGVDNIFSFTGNLTYLREILPVGLHPASTSPVAVATPRTAIATACRQRAAGRENKPPAPWKRSERQRQKSRCTATPCTT